MADMHLKKHTCSQCGGSGHITCPHCNGHGGYYSGSRLGEYRRDHWEVPHGDTLWMTCSYCHGVNTITCYRCQGFGYVEIYE